MISETGKNLTVLIITEPELNWQTFATWYSVYKIIPEAEASIICIRNGDTPFAFYQWAKRLKVPNSIIDQFDVSKTANWLQCIKSHLQNKKTKENILVLTPLSMIIDCLSEDLIDKMDSTNFWFDEYAWFLRNPNIDSLLDEFYLEGKEVELSKESLCPQAKQETSLKSLVNYKKGCGRWIDTSKGCPFSSAAGLVSTEMTVNENRIIELWKKMVPLFNAVT